MRTDHVVGRPQEYNSIAPERPLAYPAFPPIPASEVGRMSHLERPSLPLTSPATTAHIRLDSRLKLYEALVIGVQTCHIGVMHRPEQDFWWRYGTLLTQRRIDDGIQGNQDIELGECDLVEVSGSMRREVNTKTLLQDGNRVRRGRTSSLRDPGTFSMYTWTEQS